MKPAHSKNRTMSTNQFLQEFRQRNKHIAHKTRIKSYLDIQKGVNFSGHIVAYTGSSNENLTQTHTRQG
jgi:hypothetical protein